MVEIPDELRSLFIARLERRNGSYVFEIPRAEREQQTVTPGEMYRVAVLPQADQAIPDQTTADHHSRDGSKAEDEQQDRTPPVEEGEVRTVTIDTLGDQGDGIARVEHGYVLIVPDTESGQQVVIEIEDVRDNVGFATVLNDDEATRDRSDEPAADEFEETDRS